LDVEATALSQEKDEASKQRLKQVKEELSKIREELKPLKLRHRAGKDLFHLILNISFSCFC
jgi:ATP-dependent Clp protease ATP-binding subunit ClpB